MEASSTSTQLGVRGQHRFPDHIGRPYPTVSIALEPAFGLTGARVIDALLADDPSVAVMHFGDPQVVGVDVRILPDDEVEIVASQLRKMLRALAAPSHS